MRIRCLNLSCLKDIYIKPSHRKRYCSPECRKAGQQRLREMKREAKNRKQKAEAPDWFLVDAELSKEYRGILKRPRDPVKTTPNFDTEVHRYKLVFRRRS